MTPEREWEVISTYTDKQAVEDGVLVAVSDKDRVTRAAFDFLCKLHPCDDQAKQDAMVADYVVHVLLAQHGREARRIYDHNIGGGIFSFYQSQKRMWIIPNEIGGLTLMFPEDY
jgi:hypothetical protein